MNVSYFPEDKSFISLVKLIPRYFILFDVIFKQDCSLLSLFDSLLLVYRKAAYFCISILHPPTFLNSLISSNSFGRDVGGVFRVFYKEDHDICKQKKFYWFLSHLDPFLFHPVVLTGTASTMLYKSGKSWHPCHVPDLKRKVFSFSPLSMMLAMGISYMVFILLRWFPFFPALLRYNQQINIVCT